MRPAAPSSPPASRTPKRPLPLRMQTRRVARAFDVVFAKEHVRAKVLDGLVDDVSSCGAREASAHGSSVRSDALGRASRSRTLSALGGPARLCVQRQQRAAARVRLALRRHLAVVHLRRACARHARALALSPAGTAAPHPVRRARVAAQGGAAPQRWRDAAGGAHHSPLPLSGSPVAGRRAARHRAPALRRACCCCG